MCLQGANDYFMHTFSHTVIYGSFMHDYSVNFECFICFQGECLTKKTEHISHTVTPSVECSTSSHNSFLSFEWECWLHYSPIISSFVFPCQGNQLWARLRFLRETCKATARWLRYSNSDKNMYQYDSNYQRNHVVRDFPNLTH